VFFELLLPLAMLSGNILTFGKSIWLAICNLLLGIAFGVDIASLWETKIPFLVTLSFAVIYPPSEELIDVNVYDILR
jgi:hypothetical protein